MTAALAEEGGLAEPIQQADLRGQVSWALFEFARQPYVSLIFVYVFSAYYANVVAGGAAAGQEAWGFANTVQGLVVAFIAPFLGAMADRMGRRKPWLILSIVIMAPACFLLWWAMPGGTGWLTPAMIIALIVITGSCFDLGAIFHNAMLPSIVPAKDVGRLSGWGLGIGAVGTLIALIVMLFGVALPASPAGDQIPFIPRDPWFGLDPATHETERIVGPVAGVWMVVFVLPLLLWTPDRPSTAVRARDAIREGLGQVWTTVKQVRRLKNVGLYLLSRMFYNDAFVAILAYSSIYAQAQFGWDGAHILLFGFILSVFCVVGGFLGSWMDDAFGSKHAILIGGGLVTVAMLLAVSSTAHEILFIPFDARAHPVWSFPFFRTWPELLFLFAYILAATFGTTCIANSRAMMAKISPLAQMTQFFGLFALSGTATAFLGHFMVTSVTALTGSQRLGFSAPLILLVIGCVLMFWVREERAKLTP